MIFSDRSKRMLKYEKTKSKLREFNVKDSEYPNFPLKSSDLIYTTMYVLSRFCEKTQMTNYQELVEQPKNDLKLTAQYYDFAVQAVDELPYNASLLLLGAISYFILENFGNAKVLIVKIDSEELETKIEKSLYQILSILLLNSSSGTPENLLLDTTLNKLILSFEKHISTGEEFENIVANYSNLLIEKAHSDDIFEVTYLDFFNPIITIAKEYSSWNALPKWSNSEIKDWIPYLRLKGSIHLLWPAQKMIIEAGVLQNKNCVVPLPTGVGKTKSFELLIYFKLFIENKKNVVVIAPLKALCNEITAEMKSIFRNFEKIKITKFTDLYQNDTIFDESMSNVIIATPEKFAFVMRHEPQFIDSIDLFIFDEAHLFDDASRGVNYELLVTDIKRLSSEENQKILFSAILSNSEDISEWLFGENRVVKNAQKIGTSDKSIGYLSNNTQIHFYESSELRDESYFVPNIVEINDLNINNKKYKKWFFPRNDNSINKRVDLCIYFANKLNDNGAVAIFVGKPSSINTIMKRMTEISSRQNILQDLINETSANEISKFERLFTLHYDKNHIYTQASSLGVLPHYSSLVDGVREAVEFALKRHDFKAVICTSTLAEGVNIPIKYLLVHTLSQGRVKMENRKISNLIGRTARSGMYTEGTILLVDETLYENRYSNWKYQKKWEENREAFSNTKVEECRSRILVLVDQFSPDFGKTFLSFQAISNLLNKYYLENLQWKEVFISEFQYSTSDRSSLVQNEMRIFAEGIFKIIDSLENYLSFVYCENIEEIAFDTTVEEIANNTFAVYLAEEEQKKLLLEIFQIVGKKVQITIDDENKFYYAKSLYGFDVSSLLYEWLKNNEEELTNMNIHSIIKKVATLFYEIFEEKLDYSLEQCIDAVERWILGGKVLEVLELFDTNSFQKIEKIIRDTISFDMTFLIGSLQDAVTEENELLIEKLKKAQKMIKYGVNSSFSILFCEKIVNDRMIANLINELIGDPEIDSRSFFSTIKNNSENVYWKLEDFPIYYTQKLRQYLNY